MSDNPKPQEAWNMATETLKRLSRSLDMISYYSQTSDLVGWFHCTMDLQRNLAPFLEKDEFEAIENKLKELPSGWVRQGKPQRIHYATTHKVLNDVYLLMIRHMKEKGILMPKAIDPRSAVIGR